MFNASIYTITNVKNGKIYVGSTIQNINKRFSNHKVLLNSNKHESKHLQHAWTKYGKNNFKFEVLENCLPEICREIELYWINTLNTCNRSYGYNLNPIPTKPPIITWTKELRKKQSKALLKNKNSKGFFNNSFDHSKKVVMLDKNTGKKLKEFNSMTEAAKYVVGCPQGISKVCKNSRKTHKGYSWKKLETKETKKIK